MEIKLFSFEFNVSQYSDLDLKTIKGADFIVIDGEKFEYDSYIIDCDENEIIVMLKAFNAGVNIDG